MDRINDGEDFRVWLGQTLLSKNNLVLEERITDSQNYPAVKECSTRELVLDFPHIIIPLPHHLSPENICEGLSTVYGYKQVKYNYGLEIFDRLEEERRDFFKRLAVEIWDRNIHRTWMRENNYFIHNGTKDLEFCKLPSQSHHKI